MRILLDTHAFLWWVADHPKLGKRVRRQVESAKNPCFLSVASCWEMAIKIGLGKLRLPSPIEKFVPDQLAVNGIDLLPIEFLDTAAVASLDRHHGDPFDRLIIAQALRNGLAVASADRVFGKYGVRRIW